MSANAPVASAAEAEKKARRESVLQRKVVLGELLDLPTFNELVKGFVDLYKVGIKVFDEKGGKLADIKIGNGDFCGYVFSMAEGRSRCTSTVGRVKDGPVALKNGAVALQYPEVGPKNAIALNCFTGLRYLISPILFEGDVMGRVVFGPFTPEELEGLPRSLLEIHPELDQTKAIALLEKVRRAPEGTVARVMAHFLGILDTLVAAGHKTFLTSQMHIEATLESNKELETKNKRLEDLNAKLKELDRLKSSFLATVSHELRTPLTSIIGYSEMLAEGLAGKLNDEQLEYVRTIMDKGETLLKLISSILDLGQIEAGKVRLNFEAINIPDLIESAVSSVRPQAAKKGVAIEIKLPTGKISAQGDRERLRQVVVNLLANAVKFTPKKGKVSLFVSEVAQQAELNGEGFRIIVEDSGVGIPQDQFDKIFESFYQVDSSSTREFGGAGLGLAIVKSFVEGHGGRVRVSSEVGHGSRFAIVLPLIPSLGSSNQILPGPAPSRAGQVLSQGEFKLIDVFLTAFAKAGGTLDAATVARVGPGDDCAVLRPSKRELCVTTDALVEGVHFTRPFFTPEDIGHKALAVNLSDLAAMGAKPSWFVCAVAMPATTGVDAVRGMARGMARLANVHRCVLVGGNFTLARDLSLTLTAAGTTMPGRALLRAGAQAGDLLYVSGTLGDAARVLAHPLRVQGREPRGDRQRRPQPRVALAQLAARHANAAIDVSDGFLQDLGHLCRASALRAEVDAARLPRSAKVKAAGDEGLRWALRGGEDYELLLAVPARAAARFERACAGAGEKVSRVGQFRAGRGIAVSHAPSGLAGERGGHDHFIDAPAPRG